MANVCRKECMTPMSLEWECGFRAAYWPPISFGRVIQVRAQKKALYQQWGQIVRDNAERARGNNDSEADFIYRC